MREGKIVCENWELNGDCLNITGELSISEIKEISNLESISVIQPWRFMPSDKVWFELNDQLFKKRPSIVFHMWPDFISSDFKFLSLMSHVRHLDINQVKFKDKSTLASLINLESLKIYNGNLREFNFLSVFKNLRHLEFGHIKSLEDISFISNIPSLESLVINCQNRIKSLPYFGNNRSLTKLTLCSMGMVEDVSNIKQLINLEVLFFSDLAKSLEPKSFDFLRDLRGLNELEGYFNSKGKRAEFNIMRNHFLNKTN